MGMKLGPSGRNGLVALTAILSFVATAQSVVAGKPSDSEPKTIVSESASYQPLTKFTTFNAGAPDTTLDLNAPAALTGIDVTISTDSTTICDILLQRSDGDTPTDSFGKQLFYHAASGVESVHVIFDPPVALNDPLDVMTKTSGGTCSIHVLTRARALP